MAVPSYYVGQRLSLKKQACTVTYVGSVAKKPGEWIGVEWDDSQRGKHNGSHDGIKYFTCRSTSPTAASFLKPQQSWDTPKTFLQALREKYMPDDAGTGAPAVYFSSKQAEEVGFEKFARRQAQLHGIHVLVLDRMQIRHDSRGLDHETITDICANVTHLDISGNLFESMREVLDLCALLPKLTKLVLDSNRILNSPYDAVAHRLARVHTLSLSDTLLDWSEIASITANFPSIIDLTAANNELTIIDQQNLPKGLKSLDLAGNRFSSLSDLEALNSCTQLENLMLKQNNISTVSSHTLSDAPATTVLHPTLKNMDLAYNDITSWSFTNHFPAAYPAVQHLRVTGNPLYANLKAADGKQLTSEDGHMLTLARLPQLETLNYSKITDKERLNAETYYLGQIATEISRSPADAEAGIIASHPRWSALCEEYGEPSLQRVSAEPTTNPNSLAARLVRLKFSLDPTVFANATEQEWVADFPKGFDIYALLGLVGRRLGVMPLQLRLVWLTGEWDPVRHEGQKGSVEAWDSSDEDEATERSAGEELVAREVELVAGTRPLGTYIEGTTAVIRVELQT